MKPLYMAIKNITADQEFANPRLASIYDKLCGDRTDLTLYLSIIEEFSAKSVLDLGCGTGTLLCKLADKGLNLVGVDPADASLSLAKRKSGANQVTWIEGGSNSIPSIAFDMVLMTGNVAQIFLDNTDWQSTLNNVYGALKKSGILVFETRNPDARSWEGWNRGNTFRSSTIAGVGRVDSWCEVLDKSPPFISFQWNYYFEADGALLTSESTIRFRNQNEVEHSLSNAGFSLIELRDATDRPGKELVFIARKI